MPRKKLEKEETVYTEAEANEDIIEPEIKKTAQPETEIKQSEMTADENEIEDDTPATSTFVEKFARYELGTKTGLVCTLLFLLAFIFRWDWFNTSWWIVLIVTAVGLKTLFTQMTDLKEEKPEEARIAKYSFVTLIVLFVIRDLYITYRAGELLDEILKLKELIK